MIQIFCALKASEVLVHFKYIKTVLLECIAISYMTISTLLCEFDCLAHTTMLRFWGYRFDLEDVSAIRLQSFSSTHIYMCSLHVRPKEKKQKRKKKEKGLCNKTVAQEVFPILSTFGKGLTQWWLVGLQDSQSSPNPPTKKKLSTCSTQSRPSFFFSLLPSYKFLVGLVYSCPVLCN